MTVKNIRLANEAWEALFTAHTRLIRTFDDDCVWSAGLSMREYDVLYTLVKADRPLRIRELRAGVLLSQPALSRLIDRLVARDLLIRLDDADDARAVRIALTDVGRDMQRTVGREHAKSVASQMSRLNDDELRTLRQLCQKLSG